MMKKESYERTQLEILKFESEDVILNSDPINGNPNDDMLPLQ